MNSKRQNRSKKLTRQIFPRISHETWKQFKEYCQAKQISESCITETALREFFDEGKDSTLIFRRFDRLTRAMKLHERELHILSEAFGIFVQIWFAHTPEIAESQKEAARRLAWQRYERFCDSVAKYAASGHRLSQDVLKSSKDPLEQKTSAVDLESTETKTGESDV